jgi:hypothetical protein
VRFYETYRSKSQELSTVSDRQIANPRIVAHYARREPIVVESRMLCVTRRRKMNVKLHQMPFKIFKFMFRERTNIFPESNSTAFVFYDCLKCDKMLLWRGTCCRSHSVRTQYNPSKELSSALFAFVMRRGYQLVTTRAERQRRSVNNPAYETLKYCSDVRSTYSSCTRAVMTMLNP